MEDLHVPDYYQQVSIHLYNILSNAGLSDRDRKRRIKHWMCAEHVTNLSHKIRGSYRRFHNLGSQTEGSTTRGLRPDLDVLRYDEDVKVIAELHHWTPGGVTFLLVADQHTPPGYFKLQSVNSYLPLPEFHETLSKNDRYTRDRYGRVVLCNDLNVAMRNLNRTLYPAVYDTHGPAITSTHGKLDTDFVYAFRVGRGAHQSELFNNIRPNGRAKKLIHTFDSFIVHACHPQSEEKQVEHRLSFSLAERHLMHDLNEIQVMCYVLMKMLKRSFIEPILQDSLTSYHCKTVLFYLIEMTRESLWRPSKLLVCLNLCLQLLLSWTETGNCPNYFIPSENMFEKHVVGKERIKLAQLLRSLIGSNSHVLLRIEFDNVGQHLCDSCTGKLIQSIDDHDVDEFHLETISVNYLLTYTAVAVKETMRSISNIFCAIHETRDLVDEQRNTTHKELSWNVNLVPTMTSVLCSVIGGYLLAQQRSVFDPLAIKEEIIHIAYVYLRGGCGTDLSYHLVLDGYQGIKHPFHPLNLAHMFLILGSHSDIASGKLKLAAFYYKLRIPGLAMAVLHDVEKNLFKDVRSMSFELTENIILTHVWEIMSKDLQSDGLFKEIAILPVVFLRQEVKSTPSALQFEMFRSMATNPLSRHPEAHYWFDWAVVSPKVCLHYLQYECAHDLALEMEREIAVLKLASAVLNDKTLPHRETGFNILGYCYQHKRDYITAYACFRKSMNVENNHNAAKIHICVLIGELLRSVETQDENIIYSRKK